MNTPFKTFLAQVFPELEPSLIPYSWLDTHISRGIIYDIWTTLPLDLLIPKIQAGSAMVPTTRIMWCKVEYDTLFFDLSTKGDLAGDYHFRACFNALPQPWPNRWVPRTLVEHVPYGSASRLRAIARSGGDCQSLQAELFALEALAKSGNVAAFRVGPLPIRHRLDGECLIVHTRIRQAGPWVFAPKEYCHAQIAQRYGVVVYTKYDLLPGDYTHFPDGVVSAQLRVEMNQLMESQRQTSIEPRQPRLRAPSAAGPFDELNRVAVICRLSRSVKESMSQQAFVQSLSLFCNPPPIIRHDWSNVKHVVVYLDRSHDPLAPMRSRSIFSIVWGPDTAAAADAVFALGIRAITIRTDDPYQKENLWVMKEDRVEAAGDDDDAEFVKHEADQQAEALHAGSWTTVGPDTHSAVWLKQARALEQIFYQNTHTVMSKITGPDLDVRHAIDQFANGRPVISIRRVSNSGSVNDNVSNSLATQHTTFLANLPPDSEEVCLESVTITRSGSSRILEALRSRTDSVVWVTTLDRAARNSASMADLRALCTCNRISLGCLYWPPKEVDALLDMDNSVLTPQLLDRLQVLRPLARLHKSLPLLVPTIVAGPGAVPEIGAVVDRRIRQSELFVQSLSTPEYRGERAFISFAPAVTGLSRVKNKLQTRLAQLVPLTEVSVEAVGAEAYCSCPVDECDAVCLCACKVCKANYVSHCPEHAEHGPLNPCSM